MTSSVEDEMKELEQAFHCGGLVSFFLAIFIGCCLNKLCPRFKWDKSPPGPAEFRGIGNLHQVARGNSTLAKIERWRSIYGDVIALSLSHYKMVILSGYETIREAYKMPQFSGRLLVKPFHAVRKTNCAGELTRALPNDKDVLRRLRNFSVGNVTEAVMVHQNVAEFVASLKQLQGQSFVPHKIVADSVVKSLTSVVSAKMVDGDDPNFHSILENVQSIISSSSITSGPSFFLSTFFPNLTNSIEKTKNVILGNSHVEQAQEISSTPTVMDAYLTDINDLQKFSAQLNNFSESQSVGDILNLLAATSEMTSHTLVWAIYYLTKHPKIQEQLYEEIYSVLGKKRTPSLDDLNSCPLAQAVIDEVFRITSLAPLGYFHHTSSDVMFQGHFIPKGTLLAANVYALHTSPKVWGDPATFRPDRFLLRDPASGKLHRNPDTGPVLPFSALTRSSLGEVLTRNQTFLYLTSIVQKFQFSSQNNSSLHDKIELGSELLRAPKEFSIVCRERY